MTVRILHGDMLNILPTLAADSIHSVITDPPYHLTSIVKRFGSTTAAPCKVGQTGAYARASRGFMGQTWDGGDIAMRPETWAEVFRVMKPGAHLVAFGGTRTYHRMACAIEDAGFEIRDTLAWIYGSGFPKSHDVSKGIDKMLGGTREAAGDGPKFGKGSIHSRTRVEAGYRPTELKPEGGHTVITPPATPEAAAWAGWGSALKPAFEPIILARKPLDGTIAANVLRHGVGGINIDACRIETEASTVRSNRRGTGHPEQWRTGNGSDFTSGSDLGRFPANVLHDGSDEVMAAFAAYGERPGAVSNGRKGIKGVFEDGLGAMAQAPGRGDSGTAARFFYCAKPDALCGLCGLLCDAPHDRNVSCNAHNAGTSSPTPNTPEDGSAPTDAAAPLRRDFEDTNHPLFQSAQYAASSLSECHPLSGSSVQPSAQAWPLERIVQNVKAAAILCDSCATGIAQNLVEVRRTGSVAQSPLCCSMPDSRKTILSHNLALHVAGRESTDIILTIPNLKALFGCVFHAIAENTNSEKSGTPGKSGSQRLWYNGKATADDRAGSKHPTVKPLALMDWLVKLITPPGGTVLDPFAGSGTTLLAADRLRFDAIGVEQSAEYVADIRRRISSDAGLFAEVSQ